jgi:hypothetical protein
MKSTLIILSFCLIVALSACGKKKDTIDTNTNNNGNPTGGSNCTAQLADAENIDIFPADNAWNLDVSNAATDPNSTQIIAGFSTAKVKADFGAGLYEDATIGIPYSVVCGSQTKMPITFRANSYDGNYGNESDPGPYPIPANAPIEGGNKGGDSHVIVVDKENKLLYELYNASYTNGQWQASCGAIFDLASNKLRTDGWTSADAAGLPIFPGLVRFEEVLKGTIDHAIRFTLQSANVKSAYVAPARHSVNSKGGQYSLPFGAKIRLKASFDISGYSANNKVILTAMKKYGLILADIGSNMYITGAPDDRWNNDDLQKLGGIAASNFEVVKFN